MAARLIEVIEVEEKRGKGTKSDPTRIVLQYWSKDGVLLAENDTLGTDDQIELIDENEK